MDLYEKICEWAGRVVNVSIGIFLLAAVAALVGLLGLLFYAEVWR